MDKSATITAEETADLVGAIAADYRLVLTNPELTWEMRVGYIVAVCAVDDRIPSSWLIAGKIAFAEMVLLAAGQVHPWSQGRG